jgi:hypothetical protein
MIQKELKISFQVQNAKYQKYMSGVSAKTGKPYEIQESIILEDTIKKGNKLDVVEIHIKGENLQSVDYKSLIGKSFKSVPASGSNTFYVQLEDLGKIA